MAESQNDPVTTDQPNPAPIDDKPLSVDDATAAIADLLGDDPETPDPADEKEGKQASEADPLGDDEDVEPESEEEADAPSGNGQFVAASAKFKLADGTVISVGDLARNNLFQRDYTAKTEELAREREALTKSKADVDQLSRQMTEERNFLIWFAQTYAPKPPQPPTGTDDPMAEIQYAQALRQYNAFAEAYRQFASSQKTDADRKAEESQKSAQERAQKEVKSLFEKLPFLKDKAKAEAFFTEVGNSAREYYGFSDDEIANATKSDHRLMLALRDAIRYRKAQKAAPKVKDEIAKLPRMVRTPTARGASGQEQARARQATAEKLRQTGSLEDGIAAIEALIS